jgi:hypothetical protein
MNNEQIVYPKYGNAIDNMLCVYGGATLVAICMTIYTLIHV